MEGLPVRLGGGLPVRWKACLSDWGEACLSDWGEACQPGGRSACQIAMEGLPVREVRPARQKGLPARVWMEACQEVLTRSLSVGLRAYQAGRGVMSAKERPVSWE